MSTRLRAWIPTGTVVLAIAAVVALGWRDRARFGTLQAGHMAPDFTLATVEGDSVRLSSFRGRVVLLNMWATWCAPCIWEMPAMQRVYEELGPRGFEIVAVSMDIAPELPEVRAAVDKSVAEYAEQLELGFTILRDPRRELAELYDVDGLPTSFLIDRDGRIAHRILGPAEWDKDPHRAMILELLES